MPTISKIIVKNTDNVTKRWEFILLVWVFALIALQFCLKSSTMFSQSQTLDANFFLMPEKLSSVKYVAFSLNESLNSKIIDIFLNWMSHPYKIPAREELSWDSRIKFEKLFSEDSSQINVLLLAFKARTCWYELSFKSIGSCRFKSS